MNHRERGSVNVMWLIVFIVLTLAGGGSTYVLARERADREAQLDEARADANDYRQQLEAAQAKMTDLSRAVGYGYDATNPDSAAQSSAIKERIGLLRDEFPDVIGSDVEDLNGTVDRFVAHINDLTGKLLDAEGARQTAGDRPRPARDRPGDREVGLRHQARQPEAGLRRHGQRPAGTSSRRPAATTRTSSSSSRPSAPRCARPRTSTRTTRWRSTRRSGGRDGRIAEQADKLKLIAEPEDPDGEILAASASTGTCYVNRGRADLLRAGQRFQVFRYGKGGTIQVKGMVEVRRLGDDRSEASILSLVDDLDPIATGDLIAAPNYDPEMQREFVLIGRSRPATPAARSRPGCARWARRSRTRCRPPPIS